MNKREKYYHYLENSLAFYFQCSDDDELAHKKYSDNYTQGVIDGHKIIKAELKKLLRYKGTDFDDYTISVVLNKRKTGNPFRDYLKKVVPVLVLQGKRISILSLDKGRPKYEEGVIMAYYQILDTLKDNAKPCGIDEREIGIDKIEPDRELLHIRSRR